MAKNKRAHRPNETFLQRQARVARDREFADQRDRPLVDPHAAQHGDYKEAWTEIDGRRARVMINRGGTAVERMWSELSDSQRSGILYCERQWQAIDRKGPRIIRVDCETPGTAEHEALADLADLKRRIGLRYWNPFENVCRHHMTLSDGGSDLSGNKRSGADRARIVVEFVADLVAMWRGL